MARLNTDSTKMFGGKRFRYLTWVRDKSTVNWFKARARQLGTLMRVTKGKTPYGLPDGYVLWTRGQTKGLHTQSPPWPKKLG
jgi:hypothetical protein